MSFIDRIKKNYRDAHPPKEELAQLVELEGLTLKEKSAVFAVIKHYYNITDKEGGQYTEYAKTIRTMGRHFNHGGLNKEDIAQWLICGEAISVHIRNYPSFNKKHTFDGLDGAITKLRALEAKLKNAPQLEGKSV